MNITETTKPVWNAVFSIALGVAGLIMAEFLPTGVLTPMAHDLGITEGVTGQSVTATSIAAVITSAPYQMIRTRLPSQRSCVSQPRTQLSVAALSVTLH
jgi:predicted MFS family arabinose efflux permease